MKHLLIAFLLAFTSSCFADDVTEKLNKLRAEEEGKKAVFREKCEASNTQNIKNVVQAIFKYDMNNVEFVKIYGKFKTDRNAPDYDKFVIPFHLVWLHVEERKRDLMTRLNFSYVRYDNKILYDYAKKEMLEENAVSQLNDSCAYFHMLNIPYR